MPGSCGCPDHVCRACVQGWVSKGWAWPSSAHTCLGNGALGRPSVQPALCSTRVWCLYPEAARKSFPPGAPPQLTQGSFLASVPTGRWLYLWMCQGCCLPPWGPWERGEQYHHALYLSRVSRDCKGPRPSRPWGSPYPTSGRLRKDSRRRASEHGMV